MVCLALNSGALMVVDTRCARSARAGGAAPCSVTLKYTQFCVVSVSLVHRDETTFAGGFFPPPLESPLQSADRLNLMRVVHLFE